MKVFYFDRETGEKKLEKIYGGKALLLLYGEGFFSPILRFLASKFSLVSTLYGWWQKLPLSKKKISPFVSAYEVDASEFLTPISEFPSFNAFFCRKLKATARPIASGEETAIIPADGRYLVYPDISTQGGFFVKDKQFSLQALLKDDPLAEEYKDGSLVLGRLCPTDYHRFHFPTSGIPTNRRLINGSLFSVNPIALIKNIHIFSENKREITIFENTPFGKVLLLEVGATNVGTIHQTYLLNKPVFKGEEKGYFSFGGSSIVLIFKRNALHFCEDLLKNSENKIETLCKMGQPLGTKVL